MLCIFNMWNPKQWHRWTKFDHDKNLCNSKQNNLKPFCITNAIKMKIEMTVIYNSTSNPLSLTKI